MVELRWLAFGIGSSFGCTGICGFIDSGISGQLIGTLRRPPCLLCCGTRIFYLREWDLHRLWDYGSYCPSWESSSCFSEQQATRARSARPLSQLLARMKTLGLMEEGDEGRLLEREGLRSLGIDKEEEGPVGPYHSRT